MYTIFSLTCKLTVNYFRLSVMGIDCGSSPREASDRTKSKADHFCLMFNDKRQ